MPDNRALLELEKQFILDEDMEHEHLQGLIARALKFCKVDKNGHVIILDIKTTISNRIMLVLTARYLANKLQAKLGKGVTIVEKLDAGELAKILSEKQDVVSARLKELKDAKMAIASEKGVYKAAPYAIEDFLKKLESTQKA